MCAEERPRHVFVARRYDHTVALALQDLDRVSEEVDVGGMANVDEDGQLLPPPASERWIRAIERVY